MRYELKIPVATKQGYKTAKIGGCFDMSFPTFTSRRGRVQGDKGTISPTITASTSDMIVYIESIREI